VAVVFLVYAVVCPALVVLSGHAFPRAPAFAVPCPTTLFTTGLLLAMVPPAPRWFSIIPMTWSFIGGSAAFSPGVTPDLMLLAGGLCLLVEAAIPRRGRPRDTLSQVRAGAARW
jgi:hypothetical protein